MALALSHNADLIIMDEPTSGLDPVFRNEVLDILRGLMLDENKGVLFSTHITTDLDKVADYITFINRGEIIFSNSRESIMEKYAVVKGGRDTGNRDDTGGSIYAGIYGCFDEDLPKQGILARPTGFV